MNRSTRLSAVAVASLALVAGPALGAVAAPKGPKGPKAPVPGPVALAAYDAVGDVALAAADVQKVLVQVTSTSVRATLKVAEVPAADATSYAAWSFTATAGTVVLGVTHDSLGATGVTGLDTCTGVTAVTRQAEVEGEADEVVVTVPKACLAGATTLSDLAVSATGSDPVVAPEPVQDVVESLAGRTVRLGAPVRTKAPKPKKPGKGRVAR